MARLRDLVYNQPPPGRTKSNMPYKRGEIYSLWYSDKKWNLPKEKRPTRSGERDKKKARRPALPIGGAATIGGGLVVARALGIRVVPLDRNSPRFAAVEFV